uniref:Putative cyclin-F2-1 n=1 Tax=Aegilops tauschii TaxID=37682 RepID=R7WB02_AEGTA
MDKFVRDHDLADGTLHHAVAYVDRVLSVRALTTDSGYALRLRGAAAIFVAANYEDRKAVWKLKADQIARYGEFAAGKEVLDMECEMVEALGYQLGGPTAHTFLSHFMRYAEGEDKTKILPLATRLVDQSLLNYTCLRILPALVAEGDLPREADPESARRPRVEQGIDGADGLQLLRHDSLRA